MMDALSSAMSSVNLRLACSKLIVNTHHLLLKRHHHRRRTGRFITYRTGVFITCNTGGFVIHHAGGFVNSFINPCYHH